jgi:hypothetical protein
MVAGAVEPAVRQDAVTVTAMLHPEDKQVNGKKVNEKKLDGAQH